MRFDALEEGSVTSDELEATAQQTCACGCGTPVKRSQRPPYGWNTFAHGHNAKGVNGPRVARVCRGCGQPFEAMPWHVKLGYSTYCSQACYDRARCVDTLAQRFWAKVVVQEGCWLWTGARRPNGYGFIATRFSPTLRNTSAHRVAWMLANGPIPKGLCVLHS